MTTTRDYYEILGLERAATEDEIKKAYRKKAFEFHPDRNPGDDEAERQFKEAAEAYEVLRDPDKRARYDRFGHAGVDANGFHGFSSTEDIFSTFGDIFSDFFGFSTMGGGRRGPRPQPGADLRYNLRISFREAAKGTEVTLDIPKDVPCEHCGGNGAEPGHPPETCKQCGGAGQIHQSQGFFRIAVTCPICRGQGTVVTTPCSECRGRGVNQQVKELSVRVPAGVDNGSRLRLRGEGEPGTHGGPPGDLYVVISVEEDKVFRRQGQDLIYTTEVSFVQAALGDKIEVPTLDEPLRMEIPKGVQSGEVFKLKGKGLPYLGSTHSGNLLVEVKVKTPTSLSKKQEELLREFQRLEEERPMKKVKDFIKKAGEVLGG
ncbi:molecular chaperone DnaJ [Megalodesulfovibrio gigas]|uniref:Chaperone protein DnaJ n=1 Tax=Megalodesulfovibrio gigas (strain ATCC 19364 / DSM 1382 / NCIMB 9332 / VKM B-1759) TaxID=1121448 RepID=T2G7E0_MEGG1|nr:molecular chaperone DnaJ [Megalodesulfovibrio gigas]AGW12198.1 putative chaperone protein DnaJ [Megalodesulfovibrio gigas DSM 1382 = ATCC 19364]